MKRHARYFLAVTVFALSGALVVQSGAFATPAGGAPSSGPVILPTNGVIFGVHLSLDEHNGLTRQESMTNYEALVKRPMAEDRQFYLWDDTWPTADDYADVAAGRLLYLSWDAGTRDGECVMWADIASGVYDSVIDAQATKVKTLPAFIFSFGHEPMTQVPAGGKCGEFQDYINAYRYVRARFIADGVTNATYAWTVTAQSFDKNNAINYYPGDDVVDLIAADGYNWFGCIFHSGPWREFNQVFQAFYTFGSQHNKQMFVAEYGTGEDPDDVNRKAQWFSNAADQLKKWPLIKGVSYFNVGGGPCARYADSSPQALASFQSLGDDPFTNPPMRVNNLAVSDFAFTPKTLRAPQGTATTWTFNGPSSHTATDNSGMALFDSGTKAPASTFTYFYLGAGKYNYHCTIHTNMTGTVNVPAEARPSTGNVSTTFTITWAADHLPAGYTSNVQIKRPGSTSWANWLSNQTLDSATFVPDSGPGTYTFRARFQKTAGGMSGWSPTATIQVS
jgi:plastocyanin